MKTKFAKFVFVLSCIVALLTVAAAYWWISGLMLPEPQTAAEDEAYQRAGLNVIAFIYLVAPALGAVSLFCLVASATIFSRRLLKLDLWSLGLSGGSLLAVVGQIIYLVFML